jgi:hypothetical protein
MTGDKQVLATTLNQARFRMQYKAALQASKEITLGLLKESTPVQSGETREAWEAKQFGDTIDFMNDHVVRGYSVVQMLSSGTKEHAIEPLNGKALANEDRAPWGPYARVYANKMKANQNFSKVLQKDAPALAASVAAQAIIGYYKNGASSIQGRSSLGRFTRLVSDMAGDQ